MEGNNDSDTQNIQKIKDVLKKYAHNENGVEDKAHTFHAFYIALKAQSKKQNLVSKIDFDEFLYRHICDSLSVLCVDDFAVDEIIVDIGAGGGFPGIPIKIMIENSFLVSVESVTKKARFVENLIRILRLEEAIVKNERAEEFAHKEFREKVDKVVSRAVAAINVMSEISLPLLKKGGKLFLYKGINVEKELKNAEKTIDTCGGVVEKVVVYRVREEDPERKIVVIRKIAPSPEKYPRRTGIPFKRPLH